jgi:hypothetical protein
MATNAFASSLRLYRETQVQLTQAQFAVLVGMGVASVNRFERGAPPSPAHKQLLEGLITDPNNLLRALEGKEGILGAATCRRLRLFAERSVAEKDLYRFAAIQRNARSPDTVDRREFDLTRLMEMVKFFTREGEWRTKLNKLLFYADFLTFRELGKSVSGTRYVIGNFGPIPDDQEGFYSALIRSEVIEPREEFARDTGEPVEKLVSRSDFDRRKFELPELRILEAVKAFFGSMSAKQIADYSHQEHAYRTHSMGETIPYTDAAGLRAIPVDLRVSKRASSSLAELAAGIVRNIPPEEIRKLPKDGASNPDRYLYGQKNKKLE